MLQKENPPAAATAGGSSSENAHAERASGSENSAPTVARQAERGLRPYQRDVIAEVNAAITAGVRRILLVAPTGAGKTVIAADIVRRTVDVGCRVLFLAHRRELIAQATNKLYSAGIDAGIILAGFPARPLEPVQVASVATLWHRALRTELMDLPRADLVMVDEAHHGRARTYRRILESYPDAVVIGLTATPCRGDGRGLGNIFERIVECPPVAELIKLGHLVGARIYAPVTPDLSGVRVERGDYVEKQLAARMDREQLVGDIVENWMRLGERRPTVVFATSVAHSVHIRDEFRRAGVWAEHIDGSTPSDQRDAILAKLASGAIEVVSNCAVLTEGWDQPSVSCLVLARPTKHPGLYRQMIGRVLRPAPGKTDAIVLDHAGAVFEHGFPDDPVRWTLDEDRRAENPAHAARGGKAGGGVTTCPECKAVRLAGKPCPLCNWQPTPRPVHVDTIDGELGRVDRERRANAHDRSAAEKAAFHCQLLYIANERGRKPGWAAYAFKEKFGEWPAARSPQPEPPTPEVRAWVRHRDIAYAKAMSKRGAA